MTPILNRECTVTDYKQPAGPEPKHISTPIPEMTRVELHIPIQAIFKLLGTALFVYVLLRAYAYRCEAFPLDDAGRHSVLSYAVDQGEKPQCWLGVAEVVVSILVMTVIFTLVLREPYDQSALISSHSTLCDWKEDTDVRGCASWSACKYKSLFLGRKRKGEKDSTL